MRIAGAAGAGLTVERRATRCRSAAGALGHPGTGTGLVGLAERASLAGGRLEHGPAGNGDFG